MSWVYSFPKQRSNVFAKMVPQLSPNQASTWLVAQACRYEMLLVVAPEYIPAQRHGQIAGNILILITRAHLIHLWKSQFCLVSRSLLRNIDVIRTPLTVSAQVWKSSSNEISLYVMFNTLRPHPLDLIKWIDISTKGWVTSSVHSLRAASNSWSPSGEFK